MSAVDEPGFDWAKTVAERQIVEAMEAGEFDNIPGMGQPLELDDDPFTPISVRLLNKILKSSGAVPEWVQAEKDIAQEKRALETARERGLRGLRLARNGASRERAAERLRSDYRDRLQLVNDLIFKYNYIVPVGAARVFFPHRIKEEMAELERLIEAIG